jgi:hypothetical protein
VFPATLRISCSTWAVVFSSHIVFSFIKPDLLGFVIVIISPRSCTCSLHCAACLYTFCLFTYSIFESEILQFIFPLLFLMPSYSYLRLDFDGHSSTNLCSPGGAFTLMQPVIKVKFFPSYAYRAVFHCSRSPTYLFV